MQVLKQLLGSKKFVTALGGVVLSLITALLPDGLMTPELRGNLLMVIVVLCGTFVAGQAVADHGKEAKKLEIKHRFDSESSSG